jgi:hypothetical protein
MVPAVAMRTGTARAESGGGDPRLGAPSHLQIGPVTQPDGAIQPSDVISPNEDRQSNVRLERFGTDAYFADWGLAAVNQTAKAREGPVNVPAILPPAVGNGGAILTAFLLGLTRVEDGGTVDSARRRALGYGP